MVIGVNVIHQYQLFFDATELRFHGVQSERIPYRIGLVNLICIRNRIYLFRSILLKKCIICLNTNCQSRMAIEKKICWLILPLLLEANMSLKNWD